MSQGKWNAMLTNIKFPQLKLTKLRIKTKMHTIIKTSKEFNTNHRVFSASNNIEQNGSVGKHVF